VQALGILAAVGVGCLIAGEREEGWVHLAVVGVGCLIACERERSGLGSFGCCVVAGKNNKEKKRSREK